MEAEGLTIEAAGAVSEGAGHFHLMVDAGCLSPSELIPADETHIHLAVGESETELSLPAGEHTLCLQAGDGHHAALVLTDEITVAADGGETTTLVDGREASEVWEGTYEGEVVLECQEGAQPTPAALAGREVAIVVFEGGPPLLQGSHQVTGSCIDRSSLVGEILISGKRTPSGFTFPSATTYGVPGSFTIRVNGDRAEGRLSGEVEDKGAGLLTIDFDLRCTFGC
jgi:hypothetical protein